MQIYYDGIWHLCYEKCSQLSFWTMNIDLRVEQSDQLSPENSLLMNCLWHEPVGGAWNKMAQLLSLCKPFTSKLES